ncbi:hypothetical protein Phum_PHUM516050 [Pediculus humanus corporis]|uniref:Uncharacterized protein n=1 Tax=Pediculus humanus subsp. corporis TaxID=121224 RepID=E0VYN5_PEDHC|nr:uncharacterized protein Phum_PHUM516050 [Pediculus humanus corporis]EEB18491.1 hypothetical protein Phum_PHUM516050 [Pediculus humanus corporis]
MARKIFRIRAVTFITLLVICIVPFFCLFFVTVKMMNEPPKNDREELLNRINQYIKSENKNLAHEGLACRVPILDVNAKEILDLIQPVPKVICNKTKDWVEVHGSILKISEWAKIKYGFIKCSFTDIIRETDHVQHQGMTTSSSTEYNLENSDVVQVFCMSENVQ